jgi:hypothetical protein
LGCAVIEKGSLGCAVIEGVIGYAVIEKVIGCEQTDRFSFYLH